MVKITSYLIIFALIQTAAFGQDISLYQQFEGRFDFTFIGNTLNPIGNSFMVFPEINTSSSADLSLQPNDIVEKAYLYWAGCGAGDFEVKLNNAPITPQRIFQFSRITGGNQYDYFSAFADITSQVQLTGSGTYELSELDLNPWISYFFTNRTNFGGWAIVVILKNENLPFNQINVYDGLQAVPNAIAINLSSLNVIDDQNAKIGFVAWEGDADIQVNENLSINSNTLGNPPLNPFDNAFNGSNSLTGNGALYNMDLDVYEIQNNIEVGDTSVLVQLSSGQDFVMINAIVTKLNAQVPDAEISIEDIAVRCNSREVTINYLASNYEGTKALPSDVPIAIYVNDVLVSTTQTQNAIDPGGSESGIFTLNVPDSVDSPFNVRIEIDDDGNSQGIVTEINENNNSDSQESYFEVSAELEPIEPITTCNEGLGSGTFDLSAYEVNIKQNPTDLVTFFPSLENLMTNSNPITELNQYYVPSTPATVFVKVDNGTCFQIGSFELITVKCKPTVYNYVSANNDGINDTFTIKGLRDVFTNFKLQVYNRWGKLVWMGNNTTPNWDGVATEGMVLDDSQITDGTYFYSLELNDPAYPEPLYGYLFLKK